MNKNTVLYTILFTFGISFILVVPLSLANEATKEMVKTNRQVASSTAILQAMGFQVDYTDPATVLSNYGLLEKYEILDTPSANTGYLRKLNEQEASQLSEIKPLFFKGQVLNEIRYASTFSGPGLWGTISIVIGYHADLSCISGMKILAQAETPGLGGRIDEPWFSSQFVGQSIKNPMLRFNTIGNGKGDADKDNEAVDGVTGATITSNSVRDIMNSATSMMLRIAQGGIQ